MLPRRHCVDSPLPTNKASPASPLVPFDLPPPLPSLLPPRPPRYFVFQHRIIQEAAAKRAAAAAATAPAAAAAPEPAGKAATQPPAGSAPTPAPTSASSAPAAVSQGGPGDAATTEATPLASGAARGEGPSQDGEEWCTRRVCIGYYRRFYYRRLLPPVYARKSAVETPGSHVYAG